MAKGQKKQKQEAINQSTFENLCGIQCTEEEICSVLGVTDKTLNSWCNTTYGVNFSEIFKQKRGLGKVSLRRTQWKLADKNVTMAIWLGKQYLDQRDNIEVRSEELTKVDRLLAEIEKEAENVNK